MNNNIKYNLFLFLSNLSRSLVEVFNISLLYELGYSIKNILLYYIFFFLFSIFINIFTIISTNYVKTKYILIISNILFCFSYYYLNNVKYTITNLITFAFLTSLSAFSYHSIRHYYALKYINKDNRELGNIIIYPLLGIMIASYLGPYLTEYFSLSINIIIMFIISLLSIIPIIKLNDTVTKEKIKNIHLDKKRIIFFILEQGKVLFLLFEPLYLYLYISNSFKYIGIFNLITLISNIFVIKYITKKINILNKFKYLNLLLILILVLKLNIANKIFLLLIAFFEGIFIKIYEIVSIKNLYTIDYDIKSYLIKVESIFIIVRLILVIIFYIFINNIKIILYILIIIILISGFIIKDITK